MSRSRPSTRATRRSRPIRAIRPTRQGRSSPARTSTTCRSPRRTTSCPTSRAPPRDSCFSSTTRTTRRARRPRSTSSSASSRSRAKRGLIVVHDNAYSEITFDGYRAPSFLEAEGAKDVGVEIFSLSKGWNMTGWRAGWIAGNAEVVERYRHLKTNLDSGMFEAVQAAAVAALTDAARLPARDVRGLPAPARPRRRRSARDRPRRRSSESHAVLLGARARGIHARHRSPSSSSSRRTSWSPRETPTVRAGRATSGSR